MKANEIKFGIEVETHINDAFHSSVGSYRRPMQVRWLPLNWKVGSDCSIRTDRRNRCSAEFVSPVLVGEHGLHEAYQSIQKIQSRENWDPQVNRTCGVHVTITFPKDNAAALARLVCLFANVEEGLYAVTGSKSRRSGCYAKSIKHHGSKSRAEELAKMDRFHALNLTHLARGKDRVEFRLFSGSLNAEKIISWVRMVLAIAELCLSGDREVAFTAPEGKVTDSRGKGRGERAALKLLNLLGWRSNKKRGFNGKRYGVDKITGLPTVSKMAKILQGLAKKYDNE